MIDTSSRSATLRLSMDQDPPLSPKQLLKNSKALSSSSLSETSRNPIQISHVEDNSTSQSHKKHRLSLLRSLKTILSIIEVDPRVLDEVVKLTLPYFESFQNKLFESDETRNLISNLIQDHNQFLSYDLYIRKVVKVQSLWRGYRTRKTYKQISTIYKNPQLRQRNQTVAQLYNIEKTQVKMLQVVVHVRIEFVCRELYVTIQKQQKKKSLFLQNFILPLKEANMAKRSIITENDIQLIFPDAEKLLAVHKKILAEFEKMMEKW